MIAEQERVQHQEPEWRRRDDQSRQAGGDVSFRVGEREIAAHEQKHTDNGHLTQLPQVVTDVASAQSAERQHENAGNKEANAAHQRRRNALDGNVNGQVGRTPEEIDQAEGEDHAETKLALG